MGAVVDASKVHPRIGCYCSGGIVVLASSFANAKNELSCAAEKKPAVAAASCPIGMLHNPMPVLGKSEVNPSFNSNGTCWFSLHCDVNMVINAIKGQAVINFTELALVAPGTTYVCAIPKLGAVICVHISGARSNQSQFCKID